MARRRDMGTLYAQHMGHFGCGVAMYHPVSAADMQPPCVGYLDSNRRWNHLTNIEWAGDGRIDTRVYEPLEKIPQKMAQLDIEWRPRTSLGVRQYMVEGKGETPDVGLPAGASASVRYASKTKFGAVLIAQKPITLTSYNDETLFRHWLASNRAKLAELHGVELSRYGLWLVTRTYTCPKASINAWESKDEDASMSVKVKANMVGDFGGDLDWSEKGTDKDWAHYAGEQGVVAFFDGIEIPAWQLWLDGAKARLGAMVGEIAGKEKKMLLNRQGLLPAGSWKPIKDADPRSQSAPGADDAWVPSRKDKGQRKQIAVEADSMSEKAPSGVGQPRQNTTDDDDTKGEPPAEADLWGSSTPLRQGSPASRSLSRGRQQSVSIRSPSRNVSTPSRLSKYLDSERYLIRDVPDPALRLSTASTTTGNHGITTKDYAIDGAEHSPPDRSRPHELRRKTPTPSLRSSSLRDVYA